jgi:hypothetical protein
MFASIIAPILATFAPVLTPFHTGGLRLGIRQRQRRREADRRRAESKKRLATRDHADIEFVTHCETPFSAAFQQRVLFLTFLLSRALLNSNLSNALISINSRSHADLMRLSRYSLSAGEIADRLDSRDHGALQLRVGAGTRGRFMSSFHHSRARGLAFGGQLERLSTERD